MWRAIVIVVVALSANSLAIPQSMVTEYGIRAQNLHIDHLEHEVDELEHKLAKLSKETTPWDVQMLTARLRRHEGRLVITSVQLQGC